MGALRGRWLVCGVAAVAVCGAVYGVSAGLSTGSEVELRPKPSPTALGAVLADGGLLVRSVDIGAPDREGGVYELSRPGGVEAADGMGCVRVHVSAAGPGLCLEATLDGASYSARIFDGDYRERRSVAIVGVPSRVRVSADGRFGAYTAFVDGGEGYVSDPAEFSTNTRIVDMDSGDDILVLDELEVFRNGRRLDSDDDELWGVTFGEDGRYYATLAAGTDRYLIEGRVGDDRAEVVGDDVECPSLSPDGRRIAYKKPIGDSGRWQLHVLDLDTGDDLALAERRSIDDQPEWLGNDTIAYSDGRAVYATPADGSGSPQKLAARAASPAYLPQDPD